MPLAAASGDAMSRLRRLIEARDALRPAFHAAARVVTDRFGADDTEAWATAVLRLVEINAGPSCLLAFWAVTRHHAPADGIAPLLDAATGTATICRYAGAKAATAALDAWPIARRGFASAELPRWWRALDTLAAQAPEAVVPVAERMPLLIAGGDIAAFEDFIAAGLKVGATSRQRRLNFFTLDDETARRLLDRATSGAGFTECDVATKAFVTMLWGRPPLLRARPHDADAAQRRSTFADGLILLPETYRGVGGEALRALYRAAAAHAQAHLIYGGERFALGSLKSLQVALVTLIEDARVEALAMRQFPGLRRLWSPYHVAAPAGIATAPTLMARLARALFDPDHQDDDGFVGKGRQMFAAVQDQLGDPAISRRIGMLLGNDLGQMRVQFNAKTYVVEPIYRDDGAGLWTRNDSEATENVHAVAIDTAKPAPPDSAGHADTARGDDTSRVTKAQPVAAGAEGGIVVATYPEWDRVQSVARADWTTVRELPAVRGDGKLISDAQGRAAGLRRRIRQLVRTMRIGRTVRLKRQLDGHDLDIDAMLEAGVAQRSGTDPDPRIFRSNAPLHRDLAVLILIDTSQSTRDRIASGETILDIERAAVALLAEALNEAGDPFGLFGFASNTREAVEITPVKRFSEGYGPECLTRLAGLAPRHSTRLGAALRHAGATIDAVKSYRKLVIVLTDGQPSDIDVADPLDLIEDARHAATALRARGIDSFGVVLDAAGIVPAARIFGRGNTMLVSRLADLPKRLSELYFRLARR